MNYNLFNYNYGVKKMKRVISAFLGIILIAIVVYLAIKSGSDNRYIVPFGLASALVAPIGISALGYSIKKDDITLKKLAMVPEIDELIMKAKSEEEKIEKLKRDKEQLLLYIKNETRKSAKAERKKVLEEDVRRILKEYKKVNEELESLGKKPDIELESEEMRELYKLISVVRTKNDGEVTLSFGGMNYVIHSLYDLYNLPAIILIDQTDRILNQFFKILVKIITRGK